MKRLIILLIAGGLLPLSLAPWHWWPMGIFSAAALAVTLQSATAKQAYWRTVVFSFAMFAVGASWVYVSMNVYGNASVPLSLLLTGLFVTTLSLIFALPFLLYGKYCSHRPLGLLIGFPAVWIFAEWGLSWILTGFPWVFLGYGHLDSWLAGWAPVAGVWGISWIVALSAATLALWVCKRLTSDEPSSRKLLIAALIVSITLWISGLGLKQINWTKPVDQPLKVGLLQPNISQHIRWQQGELEEILSNNLALSELLWGNDLVIWPESAIPQLKHRVEPLLNQLTAKAEETGATFITGIPVYDFETQRYLNSVIATGLGHGEYNKQHLVPFGEYVPMENILRGLIDFFDLPMSAFSAGTDNQPHLAAGNHSIGTAICYEIAYPELVRKAGKDASVLLTVSNDTWFGDSLGPLQHLSMAQMRALENGKPLIRATNDGITALVNYRGGITDSLPQFTSGTLSGEILPRIGTTPYGNTGSWPVLILASISLGLLVVLKRNLGHSTPSNSSGC